VRGNIAQGHIISENDYTLQPCHIAKGQGHFAHGETAHKAQEALVKKIVASMDVDARLAEFRKTFRPGERYGGAELYKWHGYLTGSCEQGREQFVRDRKINLDDKFTVEEFVGICRCAYGGGVIAQLGGMK